MARAAATSQGQTNRNGVGGNAGRIAEFDRRRRFVVILQGSRAAGMGARLQVNELLLQPVPRQAGWPACVTVARQPGKAEQLQAMRRFRAPWPADFSFDRDEANVR